MSDTTTTDTPEFPLFDALFDGVEFPCLGYIDFPAKSKQVTASDRFFCVVIGHPSEHKVVQHSHSPFRNNVIKATEHSIKNPTPLHKASIEPDRIRPLSERAFLGAVLAMLFDSPGAFSCVYKDVIDKEGEALDNGIAEFLRAYAGLADKDGARDALTATMAGGSMPIRLSVILPEKVTGVSDWCFHNPISVCLEFGFFDKENQIEITDRFYLNPLSLCSKDYNKFNRFIMQMIVEQPTHNDVLPDIANEHLQILYKKIHM